MRWHWAAKVPREVGQFPCLAGFRFYDAQNEFPPLRGRHSFLCASAQHSETMNDSSADLDGPPQRRSPRLLDSVWVIASFVLSAAATAELIDSHLPFPPVPDIAARYQYFAEQKAGFDTLFIGSSRFRNQIIPHQFDAETAAAGIQTHSFNLGYSGMWPPESLYLLRRVLALRPPHLRWVVIELMDGRIWEVKHTMRAVYWHDWKHTGMEWRRVWESSQPSLEKGGLLAAHAGLFLQRLTNPGRGAEWLEDRYFPTKKKADTSWMRRAGFDPEEKSEWTDAARADYAREVAERAASLPPQQVRPGLAVALREIVSEVHAAGAEPIFVIPPTTREEENLVTGLPAGVTVWAYNQPGEYPQLYQPEMHFDRGHLSEKGAQVWTSLLAKRFVEAAQTR